jgi:hypothetical protein
LRISVTEHFGAGTFGPLNSAADLQAGTAGIVLGQRKKRPVDQICYREGSGNMLPFAPGSEQGHQVIHLVRRQHGSPSGHSFGRAAISNHAAVPRIIQLI